MCLRPLHQHRRLLPVSVLPRIPAHTGRQPLRRHELCSKAPCNYLTPYYCILLSLDEPIKTKCDSIHFGFDISLHALHSCTVVLIPFPSDINECERPSNCQRGHCINSMGSYHCKCQKGYVLIGGRRCQGQSLQIVFGYYQEPSN